MFARALKGRNRLIEVLDKNNQAFAGMDTSWKSGNFYTLGGSLDLTDDRLDPRKGARFEFSSRLPHHRNADESEYYVNDYNLTGYAPMRNWDTLVFNLFYSRAHVTRQGLTDYALLQQRYGLNCNQYPVGPNRDACQSVEAKLLAGKQENNLYGTATPLGGTQRLRSYDNGRFYAGQALFYGVEYRWNLTDERTPFDIYLAKGDTHRHPAGRFLGAGHGGERIQPVIQERARELRGRCTRDPVRGDHPLRSGPGARGHAKPAVHHLPVEHVLGG